MSYSHPPQPSSDVPFDMREYQRRQDAEHLNLLAIFHYVLGGILALAAPVPLVYVAMGIFILQSPSGFAGNSHSFAGPGDPPHFVGGFFAVFGLFALAMLALVAGVTIQAGRCIASRRGFNFITVVSCINCLHVPLGTALGVFTLLVLNRPSVKAQFGLPYAGVASDGAGR